MNIDDPILEKIVNELVGKHRCHTVLLYGSRARGQETAKSDYDVMGVRKSGKKFRVARKQDGFYLDLFVFNEKDLKKVGENHLYMLPARILFQKDNYGTQFLRRLKAASKRPHKPLPPDEILVTRVWAHKMLDRISEGDIEAHYRSAWLRMALLNDYFVIRKRKYNGSKSAFAWLKKNDPKTYKLFDRVLRNQNDIRSLKQLVHRVTKMTIKD